MINPNNIILDTASIDTLVTLITDLDFAITSYSATERIAADDGAVKTHRERLEQQRNVVRALCVKAGIDFADIEQRATA